MIEVQNICKRFEEDVLQNISFRLEEGQTAFITGQSGIGKTTLLHIMMGLMQADSGNVKGVPAKKSCVFQEDRLLENLSVWENLKLVSDLPEDVLKAECAAILPEDVFYKPVKLLSGGMKRRVAILRAMTAESDIIFMDEPFKGLDTATKESVVTYVKERKAHRTLLIVTHDKEDRDMFGPHKHVHIG